MSLNIKFLQKISQKSNNLSEKPKKKTVSNADHMASVTATSKPAIAKDMVSLKPDKASIEPKRLLPIDSKSLLNRPVIAPPVTEPPAKTSIKITPIKIFPPTLLRTPAATASTTPATERPAVPIKRQLSDSEITNNLLSIKNPKLSIGIVQNGNDFYFEQQRNNSICGLCALRNYVGAPWISLKILNNIKRNHFAGKAVVATACDNINKTLETLKPQMEKIIASPNSKIPGDPIALLSKLEQLATSPDPDGEKIIGAINALLPALNAAKLNRSSAHAILQRQVHSIRSDCLDVSVGGSDPAFVLEALQRIDPNAAFEHDSRPLNYGNVFQILSSKKANRGIVCANGHFVAVRKDGRGQWYILDSLRSSPAAAVGGGTAGSRSGQKYSGIIYSTSEIIDGALIDKLIADMAPKVE